MGKLIAFIMSFETSKANKIALDLLKIQPNDKILKVGFAHGKAIRNDSSQLENGLFAGIDISETMLITAENRDGFISIERFQSLSEEGKILSLSFWQDEAAVEKWRNLLEHRVAQKKGRESLFHSYRIRVAQVVRDYTESDRNEWNYATN